MKRDGNKSGNKSTYCYRGSFTIEAAYVVPMVLLIFVVAIEMAISLQTEIKKRVEQEEHKEPIKLVEYMYKKEYIEELLGEGYED